MITRPSAPRSRWRAITVAVVLTAFVLFMAVAPGVGAARAASGDILVSLDGVNWSATLPRGLFSGAGTVVPGERMSRTLWIKNGTSTSAILRLSIMQTAATSSLLARAISISATGRGTYGSSLASQDGTCAQLLPDQVVLPGRFTPIVVTLAVADLQSLQAQGQSATISLIASMSARGGVAASPCPPGGTGVSVLGSGQTPASASGSLAFTGAGLQYPAIMIASLLSGLGLFVVLAARRRRCAE
jgi:hypothetical protein